MKISPNELPLGLDLVDGLETQDPIVYPRPGDRQLNRSYQASRMATVVNVAARQRGVTVYTVIRQIGNQYVVEISKRPITLD